VSVSTAAMSTASLKDSSFGDDKFIIGLTLVFYTAAMRGFTLNPFMGALSKGPLLAASKF